MNNFPAMTEEQWQKMISDCQDEIVEIEKALTTWGEGWISYLQSKLTRQKIALAALTADTSKLAKLAAKVRKVREDAADFDGDRRGMWEYQEEQEQLLLEEAVKYTSPPAPVLRVPDEVFEKAYNQHLNGLLCGDNNKTAAKEFLQDCINSQSAPPEASNEQ